MWLGRLMQTLTLAMKPIPWISECGISKFSSTMVKEYIPEIIKLSQSRALQIRISNVSSNKVQVSQKWQHRLMQTLTLKVTLFKLSQFRAFQSVEFQSSLQP